MSGMQLICHVSVFPSIQIYIYNLKLLLQCKNYIYEYTPILCASVCVLILCRFFYKCQNIHITVVPIPSLLFFPHSDFRLYLNQILFNQTLNKNCTVIIMLLSFIRKIFTLGLHVYNLRIWNILKTNNHFCNDY